MISNLYNLFIRNLFSFKGRASRKEYVVRFITILFYLFILNLYQLDKNDSWFLIITFWISIILTWISMLQYFLLAVRRLHDFNATGWFVLIFFVPFGQLLILWLMFVNCN